MNFRRHLIVNAIIKMIKPKKILQNLIEGARPIYKFQTYTSYQNVQYMHSTELNFEIILILS